MDHDIETAVDSNLRDWRTKNDQELTRQDIAEMRTAASAPRVMPIPERVLQVNAELVAERNALREAVDDLWACMNAVDVLHLQPATLELAKATHELLNHAALRVERGEADG